MPMVWADIAFAWCKARSPTWVARGCIASSIGGNLLQRTRCLYFRDVSAACNRRTPGTGCSEIEGRNRTHAILGTSQHCVATHPSDLAVVLVALDAVVVARDTSGNGGFPWPTCSASPPTHLSRSTTLAPAS